MSRPPQQPPTPQQNAEAALGWPLYEGGWQHPEGRVDELTGEMAHIAFAGLSGFVDYRTKQETFAAQVGMEIDDQTRAAFRLDEAGKALLNKELHGERKNLQILQGMAAYARDTASGDKITELRGYQENVAVHKLYGFTNDIRSTGDLAKACSFILPTGTGKTATFIHITEAVKYREDPRDPVKTLVIEPVLDLISQTQKAYKRFVPDLKTGIFTGKKKQLANPVVIATRESFNRAVERGDIKPDDFDVVIVDEIQEMLGARTEANLKSYCQNKLLIGTTATPDRTATVTAREMFPPIYEMYLPEAIGRKLLAPARAASVKAPVTEEVRQAAEQRLGIDLSELPTRIAWRILQREATLQAGEKFATAMVEDGLQTLVRCKPGKELAEAKDMASRLNGKTIFDRRLGHERQMVAQLISGKMSPEEREYHYDRYNAGDIDVLVHVRVLGMGWDSPRAKGYVDLAPSSSLSDTTQNYGRLTRPYTDEEGKNVAAFGVSIIDETAPSDLVTFSDVLDQTVNDPDAVLGPDSDDERANIHTTEFTGSLGELLDSLRNHTVAEIAAEAHNDTLLDSMLAQEYVERRSKQLMPLDQAIAMLGADRKEMLTAMKDREMRLKRSAKTDTHYITHSDLRVLVADDIGRSFAPLPESGYHLVEDVAKNVEVTAATLRQRLREDRVPMHRFVDEFGFPGQYLSLETYKVLAKTYSKQVTAAAQYEEDTIDE